MKSKCLFLLFSLIFIIQWSFAQCDFVTPAATSTIEYAARNVTFSNITINGAKTTYLKVRRGETVNIKANVKAEKKRDYCPACIVQIYWGIRGHVSTCAKSFRGYAFKRKKTSLTFSAPTKDGIYYITMGGTLDYSCKNNINRPRCSPEYAFAVIQVGNPDPETKISFTKFNRGAETYLRTNLIKEGCFRDVDQTTWFLGNEKLDFDNQREIPLSREGTYQVTWSNCHVSLTESIAHGSNSKNSTGNIRVAQKKKSTPTFQLVNKSPSSTEETDLANQIANNDKFVLEHLVFDQGQSVLKAEAKRELDKLAQIMKNNPNMRILLEGHTDVRGSARKNLELSEDRVASSKAYLISRGVFKDHVTTKGWGQQRPLVVTNDVEEGKINRRVEITILSR